MKSRRLVAGAVLGLSLSGLGASSAHAHRSPAPPPRRPALALSPASDQAAPAISSQPALPAAISPARTFDRAGLERRVQDLATASHLQLAVSVRSLAGNPAPGWDLAGSTSFEAASTYKLPLLMLLAQEVSAGHISLADNVCFESSDWEDGPYADYVEGGCFSRAELARRVGQESDNTAAHMLIRDLGGPQVLNDFARVLGATGSDFFEPNLTTAADLTALWVAEAEGRAGGAEALALLRPLLSHTQFEDGIPAGLPASIPVAHKIGQVDQVVHDSALVEDPAGAYVLTVCTQGQAGAQAWQAIAEVSAAVHAFEFGTPEAP